MKTTLTILTVCLSLSGLFAQDAGKIVYEEKMDLHRRIPPEREEMKEMIPQFNSSHTELIFNLNESLYQRKVEEELEFTEASGPNQRVMRFGRDNRVVYKNIEENKMIDSRDFMQKQFLIKGPPTVRKWKIGTKQKEILGYACFEASFQEDSATIVRAWFTPQLTVHNGPSDYQGLPGMILQVDVNEGERMITATAIEVENVDTSVIVAPSKGKEVTDEEFKKIRDEKMKEMGGPGMSGGHQMIMIRQ